MTTFNLVLLVIDIILGVIALLIYRKIKILKKRHRKVLHNS